MASRSRGTSLGDSGEDAQAEDTSITVQNRLASLDAIERALFNSDI
jgi:hypothetical protein